MRDHRVFVLTAGILAVLLGGACADAPTTPQAARPAPKGPSADLAPSTTTALGDTVFPNDTVVFAKIQSRPGGWVETFNQYPFPEVPGTWDHQETYWTPTNASAFYASDFVAANSDVTEPNSLANWAIVRQVRDPQFWYTMAPMTAWHGTTCKSPPETHPVASYDETPFFCRDHMMTAVNSGTATPDSYAVTYLTPDRLIDFSSGTALVRFDMTTLRFSGEDWVDVWITPYDDNLVVPLDDSLPDVQGYPANGLHVRMTSGNIGASRFEASLIVNHHAYRIPPTSDSTYEQIFARTLNPPGQITADGFMQTSPIRRDTFELRIGNGRFKFGMPRYNLWWYDIPIPAMSMGPRLLGVLQIGHHSFHPTTNGEAPNTWHWDNIGVAPARQFSIINANQRYVDASSTSGVVFNRPAPAQSNLRFAGYGSKFEVRFDGRGWQKAQQQDEELNVDGRFHSYWTPVPTGTTRVDFRADNDPTNKKAKPAVWVARDITIWSLNP